MIHSCSYKAGAVCNNQQENWCTGNKKDSVNYTSTKIIDDIIISDISDVYDHRIFINNQHIADTKNRLEDIDSEIQKLKKQLEYQNKAKKEALDYLSGLEKNNKEYILNKKNYEKKSINTIINKVLLLYVKDATEFNDSTVQNVLDAYSNLYHQNVMLKYIYIFLDNNMNKIITLVDKESDEETEISFELDFSAVKDIKNVLNTLFIEKHA